MEQFGGKQVCHTPMKLATHRSTIVDSRVLLDDGYLLGLVELTIKPLTVVL